MNRLLRFCTAAALLLTAALAFAQTTAKPDALRLYNEKDYAQAIAICESEIKEKPNNMDAYCVLCWSLIASRMYLQAEERATQARKVNPYDVRLMEVLGEAKYFLGKNDEALNMFQRYAANASENALRYGRVYFYMGEIYIKQSKFQHADIALSTAVRSEPLRDDWWTRLGYAREQCKNYASAIIAYDRALTINPLQYDASPGKDRRQSRL